MSNLNGVCLQNVDEEKQHDWYKQMYKSLHRSKKKEGKSQIGCHISTGIDQH